MAAPLSQVRGRFFLWEVQLNLNDGYLSAAVSFDSSGLRAYAKPIVVVFS
jgi:hypothetical protein